MRVHSPFYYHKVKNKPQGFQRQDANAVRKRSKATYKADPETAKVINAKWQRDHPEQRREAVRKSRLNNLAKSLKRERASWKRNRTPGKLAKMREYSRLWRLKKKRGSLVALSPLGTATSPTTQPTA